MAGRCAEIEPHERGMLDGGDGRRVSWEVCGSPDGTPAVVLHGAPGSGCTPGWRRSFWREDGALLGGAGRPAGIPGAPIHGRLDLSGPLDIPWQLARAWPGGHLIVVEEAGHGLADAGMRAAVVAATDRFAARR